MASTINASTSSGLVNTADTSGVLQLQTASVTAVTIDASQNVGIGTANPTSNAKATVYGNNSNVQFQNSTTGNTALDGGLVGNNGGTQLYLFNYENDSVIFGTNAAERMRIDSSGNLLVNTTSAFDSGKLCIDGGNNAFAPITCKVTQTINSTQIGFRNGNGIVGGIATNGSSTTYATSSDYRLKENIAPMKNALGVVQQLKPVTYFWKADGSDGQGFIAHELAEVVPDCVTGEKDAVDSEGNPVYQGIDTSFLIATLTAAIQEQQALIESLTTRLTALENK